MAGAVGGGSGLLSQATGIYRPIDVTSADDAAYSLTAELLRGAQQCGDGERSGRLDFQVRQVVKERDSFANPIFGDFENAGDMLTNDRPVC